MKKNVLLMFISLRKFNFHDHGEKLKIDAIDQM